MIYSAEIKLWGTTIGAVSLDDGQKTAAFEYDKAFLRSGIQVAPIMMPLRGGVYRFPNFRTKASTVCRACWLIRCPTNLAMSS